MSPTSPRLDAKAALAVVGAGLALTIAGCKPTRGEETVACTPGAHLWIGCNQACSIGQCTGDPWIQVCDGDVSPEACVDGEFIAENDDPTEICFSTCPIVQMVCPDSGHVTVTLKGYTGRTTAFTCDWRIEERPPVSRLDAGAMDSGAPAMDGGADAAVAPDDAGHDAGSGSEPGTP